MFKYYTVTTQCCDGTSDFWLTMTITCEITDRYMIYYTVLMPLWVNDVLWCYNMPQDLRLKTQDALAGHIAQDLRLKMPFKKQNAILCLLPLHISLHEW